jgi:hypothetical protein
MHVDRSRDRVAHVLRSCCEKPSTAASKAGRQTRIKPSQKTPGVTPKAANFGSHDKTYGSLGAPVGFNDIDATNALHALSPCWGEGVKIDSVFRL